MNEDNLMFTPTHSYDRKSSDIGYMTGHSECKLLISPKPLDTLKTITPNKTKIGLKNCISSLNKCFNLTKCPICNLLEDIQTNNRLSVELKLPCHLCSFKKHIFSYSSKTDYEWCKNICEQCNDNLSNNSYILNKKYTHNSKKNINENYDNISENSKNNMLSNKTFQNSIDEISLNISDPNIYNAKHLNIEYSYMIPDLSYFSETIKGNLKSKFIDNFKKRVSNEICNNDRSLYGNDNYIDIENTNFKKSLEFCNNIYSSHDIINTINPKLSSFEIEIKRNSITLLEENEEINLLKDLNKYSNSSSQNRVECNCNKDIEKLNHSIICAADHIFKDNSFIKKPSQTNLNIQYENVNHISNELDIEFKYQAEKNLKDSIDEKIINNELLSFEKFNAEIKKERCASKSDHIVNNGLDEATKQSNYYIINSFDNVAYQSELKNLNKSAKIDNNSTFVLIQNRNSFSGNTSSNSDNSIECESRFDQARYISDDEDVEISERYSNRYHISGISSELISQISTEDYGAVGYEIINDNGPCKRSNKLKLLETYDGTKNINSKKESILKNSIAGQLNINSNGINDGNIESKVLSEIINYENQIQNEEYNCSKLDSSSQNKSNSPQNMKFKEIKDIDFQKYNLMLSDCVSLETNNSSLFNIPTSCCINFKKDKTFTKSQTTQLNFNVQNSFNLENRNSISKSLTTLPSPNKQIFVENKNHDILSIGKNNFDKTIYMKLNTNNLIINKNKCQTQSPIKSTFDGVFKQSIENDPDVMIKSNVESKLLKNSLASNIYKYDILKNISEVKALNSHDMLNKGFNKVVCNDFNDNLDIILPVNDEESTNFSGQVNFVNLYKTNFNSSDNKNDYLVPNNLNKNDNSYYNISKNYKNNDNTIYKTNDQKNILHCYPYDDNDFSNDEGCQVGNKILFEKEGIKCDSNDANFDDTLKDVIDDNGKHSDYKSNCLSIDIRTSKPRRKSGVRMSIPGHRSSKGKVKKSGFLMNAKKKLMASMLLSPKSVNKPSKCKTQHPNKFIGSTASLAILTNEIHPGLQSTHQCINNKDTRIITNQDKISTNKISSELSNRGKIGQSGSINKNKFSNGITSNLNIGNHNRNDPNTFNKTDIKKIETLTSIDVSSKNRFQMLQQYFASKNNVNTTSIPKKLDSNLKQNSTKEEKNVCASSGTNLASSNIKYKSTFSQCFSPRRSSSIHKNIITTKKSSKIPNPMPTKFYNAPKVNKNSGGLQKGFGSRKLLNHKPPLKPNQIREMDLNIVQSDSGDSGVGSHPRETFVKNNKPNHIIIETKIKDPTLKDNPLKLIQTNINKPGQHNYINANKLGLYNSNNVLNNNVNTIGKPTFNNALNKPNNDKNEPTQAKAQSNLKATSINSKTKLNKLQKNIYNNDSEKAQVVYKNVNKNPESYEMTIFQSSEEDISSEDESNQAFPLWARGEHLINTVAKQQSLISQVLQIFPPVLAPNLNEIFTEYKERFDLRTSSAIWEQSMSCCTSLLENKTIDL